MKPCMYLFLAYLEVAGHCTKSKIVHTHKIGSCKVQDHTILSAYANMANEGNQPWNNRKRSPNNAAWKPRSFGVNLHSWWCSSSNHEEVLRVCNFFHPIRLISAYQSSSIRCHKNEFLMKKSPCPNCINFITNPLKQIRHLQKESTHKTRWRYLASKDSMDSMRGIRNAFSYLKTHL